MAYRKILLALAGKKEEQKVIQEALRLMKDFNAELTVIHVNDPSAGKAHMMMDTLPLYTEADVWEWLINGGVNPKSDPVDIIIVSSEKYADEIADMTRDSDLLIIGHRHKNRFLSSLIDSIDERVADKILCPMLVVPFG